MAFSTIRRRKWRVSCCLTDMALLNPATLEFVRSHADEDVRRLAFLADRFPGVDMPAALDQIRGRQVAKVKIPAWAAVDGIVYPPHLSLEQCSGEAAARYKARLVRRLGVQSMVDLTGGMGVDFSWMAREVGQATYVERQEWLCALAKENFPLLGLSHAEVRQGEAEALLPALPAVDLIYLDPARRDSKGGKTYAISDCVPDVSQLKEGLLRHARWILVKLSPMLDWHAAVEAMRCELGGVSEVHVVSSGNECKELLLLLSADAPVAPRLYCVNDDVCFSCDTRCAFPPLVYGVPRVGDMLLVPNASVMKAGCFTAFASRFRSRAIAPNSHLFFIPAEEASGDGFATGMPARCFRLVAVTSFNKKALRQALMGVSRANVAVRNFPLTAAELRKRLRLGDGGDVFIFATTTSERQHVLLVCRKMPDAGKIHENQP